MPFKLHEAAPYVTKVGIGGGITGALTMNKNTYDKLPKELQKMFHDIGKGYGDLVAKRVAGFHSLSFKKLLPAKGAKISELPLEEQRKWAAGLPNLAGDWVKRMKAKGLPGDRVIKTYMAKVRAAGEKPIRNWDK